MTACKQGNPRSQAAGLCCRHPDKNKDPGAEDKFIQISKAYEVSRQTLIYSLALTKCALHAQKPSCCCRRCEDVFKGPALCWSR